MESPVLTLLYHQGMVWAGCGDGCIYILKKVINWILNYSFRFKYLWYYLLVW